MVKKRKEQQRIGEKAVKIFGSFLEMNKELDFSFFEVPGQYDFGIDGVIQIFKLEIHTGEYYYVQIKGSKKVRVIKDNTVSFSLDIEEGDFLLNQFKGSVVFILVDLSNKKIYWHDIQTNKKTIDALQEGLRQKRKTFTLHLNPLSTLPETHREMYEYLKNTNSKIARKEVLRKLKEDTLSKSLDALEEYNKEALNIEGYSWKYGTENLNNAVMTIKDGDNVPITYYAKGAIKEEDVINIKFNAKFSNPQDYEKFNKVLRGEEDFLIIPEKSIDSLIIGTDKKKILDSGKDGIAKVRISPVKYFQKIIIYFENIEEEVEFDTQSWTAKDGSLILESADFSNNPVRFFAKIIGVKFEIFKINLDINYIKNWRDLYNNLSFISRAKGNIILYLLQGSKRLKISSGNIKEEEKKFDKILKLLNKLLIIEEKMKVTFKISPDTDQIDDQFNINVVYQLLEKGECNVNLNVRFGTKLEIKENGFLSAEIEKPHFKILDKDIIFDDKKLYIGGKVEKINEVSKQSDGVMNYILLLPNALMSFNKKEMLENK